MAPSATGILYRPHPLELNGKSKLDFCFSFSPPFIPYIFHVVPSREVREPRLMRKKTSNLKKNRDTAAAYRLPVSVSAAIKDGLIV